MARRSDTGRSAPFYDPPNDASTVMRKNAAYIISTPPPNDPFDTVHASRVAFQSVLSVLHGFATTLCIARSLANAEREVDLVGLHEAAGLLCARALDLRPEHGRRLIPRLRSVLEDLDALHTSMVPARADGPSARA
jgi:hypothetical protein